MGSRESARNMSEQLNPLPRDRDSRTVLTLQKGEDGRLRLLPRPVPEPLPHEQVDAPAAEIEREITVPTVAVAEVRARASPATQSRFKLPWRRKVVTDGAQPRPEANATPATSSVVVTGSARDIAPVAPPASAAAVVTVDAPAAALVVGSALGPVRRIWLQRRRTVVTDGAQQPSVPVTPVLSPALTTAIAPVVAPAVVPAKAPTRAPAGTPAKGPAKLVDFRAVSLSYGGEVALADLTLGIDPGEFVAIVGPSGAGKTSALRLLQGLVRPTSGRLWVDGVGIHRAWQFRLRQLRRRTGVVFQDYRLLANRSAIENVVFALQVADLTVPRYEARRRAAEQLALVGLAGREKSRPDELSGGQQQRLAIARALVTGPRILLADEPTASLDLKQARNVMRLFKEISLSGTTVVLATHDRALLSSAGARIVTLGKGRLIRDQRSKGRLWVVR